MHTNKCQDYVSQAYTLPHLKSVSIKQQKKKKKTQHQPVTSGALKNSVGKSYRVSSALLAVMFRTVPCRPPRICHLPQQLCPSLSNSILLRHLHRSLLLNSTAIYAIAFPVPLFI